MLLKSFKYATIGWELDNLSLGKANLIVGKNSSGKSRVLQALSQVVSILSQRSPVEENDFCKAEIVLTDVRFGEVILNLSIVEKKIVTENLIVNAENLIQRNVESSRLKNEFANPPQNMLLMHVSRDTIKYPVIEEIIKWAEDTVVRSFIDRESPSPSEIFAIVSKFTPEMRKHLVKMANEVGFPLKNFGTYNDIFSGVHSEMGGLTAGGMKIEVIVLQEKNVGYLMLKDLSSGMYRTIVLLILIEQMLNLHQPVLLAIDDLGEGLDYSKASKVGRKLFDICEKKNIQLIATSNEEFMMNIVDISKWNILVRQGNLVKSINADLCTEEFEKFKYMGLSNFDFFTSDFLNSMSSKLFLDK